MNNQNNQNKLPVFESIRVGFVQTFNHFLLFLKSLIVGFVSIISSALVVGVISLFLKELLTHNSIIVAVFAVICGLILIIALINFFYALIAGFLKLCFDVFDTGHGQVKTLFTYRCRGMRFIIVSTLTSVITCFGLLLLIVPGIYWMVRYMFALYAMIDKNLGVMDSLRYSWQLTETNKWRLLGLMLFCGIIEAISQMTVVGLVITIPAMILSHIYAYRWLQANNQSQ